ncbi:hypothetical protein [Kurthia sibirica]|nr:hypothetical protein [Kurthia sibirica]
MIETDHFRGEELKHYCDHCFLEGARTGFHDEELDCHCGEKLVLEQPDAEVLDLAKEGDILFYSCKKIVDARKAGNFELAEALSDIHETVGLYVTQASAEYE